MNENKENSDDIFMSESARICYSKGVVTFGQQKISKSE